MKIKTALFLRVSTKSQETSRQRHQLMDEAEKRGWEVVATIEEVISGRADEAARDGLTRIRELVAKGKIQKVMVHEVSRIGRKSSVVHKFIEDLTAAGVSLYWQSLRMETLTDDGKPNLVASMLLAVFAEMGRAESELLSERVKSGLEEARRQGVVLGRRPGKVDEAKFLGRHQGAVEAIRKHTTLSLEGMAKLTDKSRGTIMKLRRVMGV